MLPPGAVGTTLYRFSQLPPDLLAPWSDQEANDFYISAVDTSASSYAEFRRTAEPEIPFKSMRSPVTPSKVRVATSYAQGPL